MDAIFIIHPPRWMFEADATHSSASVLSLASLLWGLTKTRSVSTALGYVFRSLPPKPEPFIVDHPFFFVLRDETTGAFLFIGRVMEP